MIAGTNGPGRVNAAGKMTNRDNIKLVSFTLVFVGIFISSGWCQNAQMPNSYSAKFHATDEIRRAEDSRNVPPERNMMLDEDETVFTNWHEADTEVAPEANGNGNRAFLTLANSGSSFLQQQRFNSTIPYQKGASGGKKRRRKSKVMRASEEELNERKEADGTQMRERKTSWDEMRAVSENNTRVRQSGKKFHPDVRKRRRQRKRNRNRRKFRKNSSTPLCFQKLSDSWTVFSRSDSQNSVECKNTTDTKTINQINLLSKGMEPVNDTEGAEPIVYGSARKSSDPRELFATSDEEGERSDDQHRRNAEDRYEAEKMLGYVQKEILERTLKAYNSYMASIHNAPRPDQYKSAVELSRTALKTRPKQTRIPDYPMALRQRQQITDRPITDATDDAIGDLSCINGTFLPAPLTRHALIKYVKSSYPGHEYLEADYECASGYYMSTNNTRLLCKNRRWVGEVPKCRVRQNPSELCAEMSCEQVCNEVDGRAQCSCFEGFRTDGRNCIDVNECEKSNGGCEYKCVNTPGSYRCECSKGMKQGEDRYSCVDLNECLVNNGRGPCQDTCRNLIGGYECSCDGLPGTILSADNHTCHDTTPCNYNNSGCSHTCLSTMGRVFCLCPDGFVLQDDWKTCQDVDECAVTDLQIEACRYGCINTPGSYRCVDPTKVKNEQNPDTVSISCPPGFEATKPGLCVDINECALDNGGCSEMCENTNGSFFCACEGDERSLAADGKSCVDIDSISCTSLNPTGKGVLVCSQSSKSELWRPAGTNRPGAKCFLKCPPRYQLRGEYELTCQADGTWDGPKHGECVKYSKPRLDCPKDVVAEVPPGRDEAFVTFDQPSTDLDWFRYVRSKPSWGIRLEANLKTGVHEITFYARHPVSKRQTTCVLRITIKDGEAPKVEGCPSDIEVTGGNGTAVTWTEPTFTDNVKVMRIGKTAEPGQQFDIGSHKIEYEASDEAGWTTKCIFNVLVEKQ